jgi:hypothetical protein
VNILPVGGRSYVTENDRAIAARDKQQGAMPSYVQQRDDHVELWAAFRKHVGIGWTGERTRDFIAGWDAALRKSA